MDVPDRRFQHTAVWTGTEMIVWGGNHDGYLNTGGRYNPSTDSWTPTSTGANAPPARGEHTALWTGTEMIVWGGTNGSELNTGGRYNPSTDSWTPTSTGTNVAAERDEHTAVWTGTEMIIWGGNDGSDLNTGGRYNPSTDTWTATSTGANVPVARVDHTAVWTGTQMVVWGGDFDSYNYLNTGGRYNPVTDTWAPTSTSGNAPPAHGYPSSVWTGTEMIIWGGYNTGSFYLNSGARYNPSTNTWAPTSTGANVPFARYYQSAVWTGSEMILWGGFSGSTYLNSGGRYNPSSNSWVATSTGVSMPSARYSHSAVWTGTESIVWGGIHVDGVTAFPSLNTGGRYNPATDSWTPTSTGANVPAKRYSQSALWTGTEMVVWGGAARAGGESGVATGSEPRRTAGDTEVAFHVGSDRFRRSHVESTGK